MYQFLANFFPKKVQQDYVNLLRYSNIKINPRRFIGFVGFFGFLLALTVAFYASWFFGLSFWLFFFGFFVLAQVTVYFYLVLRADSKSRFVESILPDVLQLMASNLRAGLTTDKALLLSARPEFGSFKDEINHVGKQIAMGKEIGAALVDMSKKIKSERLGKTVSLVVSGLQAGGELAALLEQTAKNLRQQSLVDDRIRANAMMYVIFIFVAVCLGAPGLFGLSSFLVEVLQSAIGTLDVPQNIGASVPISFSEISIGNDFIMMFSVVFLITSSIMGSLILGLISKGKERDGIKWIPILIAASLAVFFISRIVVKSLVGDLFQF